MASVKRARSQSPSDLTDDQDDQRLITPEAKVVHLSSSQQKTNVPVITCSLPHAGSDTLQSFTSYAAFDAHYAAIHSNRCLAAGCDRNFPTAHFLQLHIAENHDPIVALRRERGDKVYACFVEGCDKVCADWRKRRAHLVDKHGFPREYDFLVVNSGIEGRRSLLRTPGRGGRRGRGRGRGRGAARTPGRDVPTQEAMDETADVSDEQADSNEGSDVEAGQGSPQASRYRHRRRGDTNTTAASGQGPTANEERDDVATLARSLSALTFVPASVRFGRGASSSRGGMMGRMRRRG